MKVNNSKFENLNFQTKYLIVIFKAVQTILQAKGLFYGANSLAAREAAIQATQAPSSRRRLHAGAAR